MLFGHDTVNLQLNTFSTDISYPPTDIHAALTQNVIESPILERSIA